MVLGKSHKVRRTHCLACGTDLDAASSFGSDRPPATGDATICIKCGHLMIFAADGLLRHPTAREQKEMQNDSRIAMATWAIRELHGKPKQ